MKLLVLLGIFLFPIFTLGLILWHYDHPILGTVAIVWSFLRRNES